MAPCLDPCQKGTQMFAVKNDRGQYYQEPKSGHTWVLLGPGSHPAKFTAAAKAQAIVDIYQGKAEVVNAPTAKPCPHCDAQNDYVSDSSDVFAFAGDNVICGGCGKNYKG